MAKSLDYPKQAGAKERYEAFATAYVLNGYKQQEAAIAAKYRPSHAHVQANKLLKIPYVIKKIAELKARIAEEAGLTPELQAKRYTDIYIRSRLVDDRRVELMALEPLSRHIDFFGADNASAADKQVVINIMPPDE